MNPPNIKQTIAGSIMSRGRSQILYPLEIRYYVNVLDKMSRFVQKMWNGHQPCINHGYVSGIGMLKTSGGAPPK